MIPARLEPQPGVRATTYCAYTGSMLLAEVVCPDGADVEATVDDLWHAVEATVAAGHLVIGVAYDTATGWPLPCGDLVVAAAITQQ